MRGGIRRLDLLVATAIVVLLIAIVAVTREGPIRGNAFAIDGDTLAMDGRRIRLRGLDAPEIGQTCRRGAVAYRCGDDARVALRALVAGETVTCQASGQDRYGRILATCEVRGADIGASLVRRGLAVSYGDYGAEERAARDAGLGIWAGAFETPQAWRRRHGTEERT